MLVDPDELNYLIYRYFLESGFEHAAHAFFHEASLSLLNIDAKDVPLGLLLQLLQKSLQMLDIELHLDQHGGLHSCDRPLSLLRPHSCASVQRLNASLPRPNPIIKSINTEEGVKMQTLDRLPRPVLFEPRRSLQTLYGGIDDNDEIPQLTDLFRQELKEEPAQAPTSTVQTVSVGQEAAVQAVRFVLEKLPQQVQQVQNNLNIEEFQRHIQAQQQAAAEIEETNLVEAAAKFRTATAFVPSNSSPIMQSMVMSIGGCQCQELFCSCEMNSTQEILVFGTQNGELFLLTIGGSKQKRSANLLKTNCEVVLLQQLNNRVYCFQKDGSVNVIKVSMNNNKLSANMLVQDQCWFGNSHVVKAVFSPNKKLLAVIIKGFSTPLVYNLSERKILSLFPPNEGFPALRPSDGVSYLPLARIADPVKLSYKAAQVVDVLFISDQELFFVRDDCLVQINELAEGIIFRRFYTRQPLAAFAFQDRVMLFFHDNMVIDLTFNTLQSQWMAEEIPQEFTIDDILFVPGYGIMCRYQQHLFLVNGVKPDKHSLMISQDWQLQGDAPFGSMALGGTQIFTAQDNKLWIVDVEVEGAEQREVFGEGKRIDQVSSVGTTVVCVSDEGIINLQFQVEIDV